MELLRLIIHALVALQVPFILFEDGSVKLLGTVPPVIQALIDLWHGLNDVVLRLGLYR